VLAAPARLAADDDEIVLATEAAPDAVHVQDMRVNIDHWLFPGAQNAEAGRQRTLARVKLLLAEIDRVCRLSEEQKQKLELAARGDTQRFFDQVEMLRAKFEPAANDQDVINRMWQEVQPLQAKQQIGLTGPESLLVRTLPRTLDDQQQRAYQAVENERLQFRYKAAIAVALHNLEETIALRHEQREALTRLLSDLAPPRTVGRYDYYLILHRLGNIPQAKLQTLVDQRQWQPLQQALDQARRMRATLVAQGYLAEDLDAKAPEKP
jgi:hypothetical protein